MCATNQPLLWRKVEFIFKWCYFLAVPAPFYGCWSYKQNFGGGYWPCSVERKQKTKMMFEYILLVFHPYPQWLTGCKTPSYLLFLITSFSGGEIKVFTFCFSAWSAAWGEHPHPKPVPDHLPLRQPQREPRARGHHSDTRLPHWQHPDGRDPLSADPGAQVCHSDVGRSVLICSQPWPLDNFHKSAQHCIFGECAWMRARASLRAYHC